MDTRDKVIISVGILIFLGFLFVIGLGDRGAVDLYQLKRERDRLRQANLRLQEWNEVEFRTIDRLNNDGEYVENIARKELRMIGEGEWVILKKKN